METVAFPLNDINEIWEIMLRHKIESRLCWTSNLLIKTQYLFTKVEVSRIKLRITDSL